jgi:hypothetical protein
MERDFHLWAMHAGVMDVPVMLLNVSEGKHTPIHVPNAIEHAEALVRAEREGLAGNRRHD